jgi:hypothetical protein
MTRPLDKYPRATIFVDWIAYLLIVLGIGIRLKVYIENRSLFIDEANLARGLIETSYVGLFGKLPYDQFAPPLFMVHTKLLTEIGHTYEWVLRLIPLMASIGALFVLWSLLRSIITQPLVRVYGLSLLCFSFMAIRYGTEFKQYSTDTFLALIYLWQASRDGGQLWDNKQCLKWAVLGSVGIWYSMPLVFILSGIALYFIWAQKRNNLAAILVVMMTWLLSFMAYYFMVLNQSIGSDYLEAYFENSFLSFNLSSDSWRNNFHLLSEIFRTVSDKTAISIGFVFLSFGCGALHLIRRDKGRAIRLLLPVGTLLLASALHYYTLVPRLTLFIVPVLILVICIGLDRLWSLNKIGVNFLLIVLMVLGITNKQGWRYLWMDMEFEEIRPCLAVLDKAYQKDEILYIDHEAVPAFTFYNTYSEPPFYFDMQQIKGEWDTDLDTLLPTLDQHTAMWLLFAHATETEINRNLASLSDYTIETVCHSERVALLKISIE